MAQRISLLLRTPPLHTRMLVWVLAFLFLIQLPAKAFWKTMDDGSKVRALGSWLQPESAMVVAGVWRVNQWIKDLSFSLSSKIKIFIFYICVIYSIYFFLYYTHTHTQRGGERLLSTN